MGVSGVSSQTTTLDQAKEKVKQAQQSLQQAEVQEQELEQQQSSSTGSATSGQLLNQVNASQGKGQNVNAQA